MGHGASTGSSISSTTINPISIIDAEKGGRVKIIEHSSFKDRSEWRRSRTTRKLNADKTGETRIKPEIIGQDGARQSKVGFSEKGSVECNQTTFTRMEGDAKIKRNSTIRRERKPKDEIKGLLDEYHSDSDCESNNHKESTRPGLGCEVLPLSDAYFYGNDDDIQTLETPRSIGDAMTSRLLKGLKRRPSRKVMPNWQPALSSHHRSSQDLSDGTTGIERTGDRDSVDMGNVSSRIAKTESVHEKGKRHSIASQTSLTVVADVHKNGDVCHYNNNSSEMDENMVGDDFNSFITADKLCTLLCDGGTSCCAQEDQSYLLLVDARKRREYESSHIHRAVILDVAELEANDHLKIDLCYKNIVLYDRSGKSHFKSDSILTRVYQTFWAAGHRPFLLQGGYSMFSRRYLYLCQKGCEKSRKSDANSRILPFYPSYIIDKKLYIGNCEQGANEVILDSIGINYVLNLSRINMESPKEEIDVVNFPIEETSKISLYEHSREVVGVLHKVLHNRGSSILLCCEMGTSVCACVAVLILMYELKWHAQQCVNLVKEKRPAISVDKHLWKQIKKAEKILIRS